MSRKFFSFWFIILPDVVLFFLSLIFTIQLRYGQAASAQIYRAHFLAFAMVFALWVVVFFIHGLFEIRSLRRYAALVFNILSAMLVNLLLAVIYFYFQPNLILTPRRFLLVDVAIAFLLILVWHLLLKLMLKRQFVERIYLFSFNNELAQLEREIGEHAYLGYEVLGHLNEENLKSAQIPKNVAIVLPDNLRANPQVLQRFYDLRKSGVAFYNYEDFYENLLRRVYLSELNELWFLENINYREKRLYNLAKRLVDLLFGLVALALFVVTYPFIALAIKLGGPGPILFTQERVGQYGKIFRIFKYRTMDKSTYTTWTQVNDPRITKVGNFLRKTRLDELPQALNLIRGNLSLVGPRPEQVNIVEELKKQIPFYDERHLVKPGLTGWSQLNVYAGSLEETKQKLQYDFYYIKNRSILFDVEIILKTAYYIFTWRGR